MQEEIHSSGRYTYVHEDFSTFSGIVDVHHIFVKNKSLKRTWAFVIGLIFLVGTFSVTFMKGNQITSFFGILLPVGFFVSRLHLEFIKKETVVIMPSLGVQLETHYWSGRIVHRFVPFTKIIRPILYECVTPVTCYWSLALLLRGESELVLIFKKLHPPLKMLVPIWKTLCSAIDRKETDASTEDGT